MRLSEAIADKATYRYLLNSCREIAYRYQLDYSDLLSSVHLSLSLAIFKDDRELDYPNTYLYRSALNAAGQLKQSAKIEYVSDQGLDLPAPLSGDYSSKDMLNRVNTAMVAKFSKNAKDMAIYDLCILGGMDPVDAFGKIGVTYGYLRKRKTEINQYARSLVGR